MPRSALSQQYSRRLQRLLLLVNDMKTNPCQTPDTLWVSLGVSRAMFYEDRQTLAGLGFTFHYDRQQRSYVITHDRFLPVLNLSISEVLALIMAVRQLSSSGDYTLTYDAIAALRKVVSNMPGEVRAFLQTSLDDVVLQEGFGCDASILQDLWRACQERQRVRIVHDRGTGVREWVIDPYQIFFRRRALYLDACVVHERRVNMFRVNRIQRVSFLGVRVSTPLVPYNFRERHRHSFSVFVGSHLSAYASASTRPCVSTSRKRAGMPHSRSKTCPTAILCSRSRSVSRVKWAGEHCHGGLAPKCWSQRVCARRWPRRRGG